MPDYSACDQTACPRRHACARYRMKYGLWQSVLTLKPEGCGAFWNLEEGAPFTLLSVEEADVQAAHAPQVRDADEGAGLPSEVTS